MSANLAERLPFTVHDYHQMAKAGILRPDSRVELIEGEILTMSPVGWLHISSVNKLNMYFAPRVEGRAIVSVQNPVRLSEYSEPEPDIALLRPETAAKQGPPEPADVLLLIEVADSTPAYDRNKKTRLYARHGIPELWIWDLKDNSLEIHSHLREGEYRIVRRVRRDETITPENLPDLTVNSNDILAA